MPNSNHTSESNDPRLPVDEKGRLLEMPPEYLEAGEEEPVYERAQLNQNLWHHYAVR